MFIVPYILNPSRKSTTDFTLDVVWIFTTNGGTGIWETDEESSEEEIIQTYLLENGFHGTSRGVKEGCLFYEVDPSRTNLSDFYMWTDFLGKGHMPPLGCDVWRPFFWVGSGTVGKEDEWGWSQQAADLTLGRFGSIQKVWNHIGEFRS